MSRYTLVIIFLCLLVTSIYYFSHLNVFKPKNQIANVNQTPISANVLGEQTKTADCIVNGPYPDPDCTPGAVFPDATVEKICKLGYSASVRDVSQATKNAVYAEYGIYSHKPYEYEVDHLISLELGGSNEVSNLFPEAAEPRPGYHEKDLVENYLHHEVCVGRVSLSKAQELIAKNWLQVYKIMPR